MAVLVNVTADAVPQIQHLTVMEMETQQLVLSRGIICFAFDSLSCNKKTFAIDQFDRVAWTQ